MDLYRIVCSLLDYLLSCMRKLGFADPTWTLREAIKKQVEIEDRVVFAKQPVAEITHDYTPKKFELSLTAKEAFGKGIYYVNLLRKI